MLLVALCLSAVAAFYSIVGLAAIFAAAVLPIILMGSILEVAKLTCTVWLHEYWKQCKLTMKIYLVPAVFILMVITSMGIFGFLSKAHSDQSLVSGDVQAKIALYDEKIKIERDNIDAAKRAMSQMDAQVDQMLGRTDTDRGAERAVQIRKNQAKERANLANEIGRAQKEIARLNNEAAPIRAEVRKVEAEVGPIKYIAALIYGDNPDQNLLERAVRWVIILLVAVFDPLAVMMLLAATESMAWTREARAQRHIKVQRDPVEDDKAAMAIVPPEESGIEVRPWTEEELAALNKDTGPSEVVYSPEYLGNQAAAEAQYEQDDGALTPDQLAQIQATAPDPSFESTPLDEQSIADIQKEIEEESQQHDEVEKRAMREWKQTHPETTIKEQRRLFEAGAIKDLPWRVGLQADNESQAANVVGFGIEFPANARKGDQWLRVDNLPTKLFKYNGQKWIEIDKSYSDQYAYDTAYIDHLIDKLSKGEYDAELLSDAERTQIAHRLSQPSQDTGDN